MISGFDWPVKEAGSCEYELAIDDFLAYDAKNFPLIDCGPACIPPHWHLARRLHRWPPRR